jgi:peptidoglycan/xylan/chitin deacetylase (PgdA/CDA1 family)
LLEPAKPLATARALPPRTSTTTAPPPPTTTTTTTPRLVPDVVIPAVEHGLAPVLTRIATKQPVVFLGIDDGANKAPFELQLMQDNDVHASLFLADAFIGRDPLFFASFVNAGNRVENHSVSHRPMPRLSYAEQVKEICGEADLQAQQFGRRPILFRPPGGAYNTNTRRAAATCGMRAVVTWIAKANAGSMQYQLGHGLRPGDIVLMHFRPEFRADMDAFLNAARAAGLRTELLEDWLSPPLQERQHRWHGFA